MGNIYPHWDIFSVIFYCVIGVLCSICVGSAKKKELETGKKQKLTSLPYIICILSLTFVAAFRYIGFGVGGSDATSYRIFFENCLFDYSSTYYKHYDALYRIVNYLVRYISSDFSFFNFVFYGFISICYISFVNEFLHPKDSKVPLILMFYLFLRGFNTYRTEFAIAFLMLSLIFYKKDKRLLSYIFAFSTFFIHKASILYALLLLFLDVFKERKIKIKFCIVFILLSLIVGKILQPYLMNLFAGSETNAYASYISRSLKNSFFDNYWKICFEQLFLLFMMIFFRRNINFEISVSTSYEYERNLIWQICVYDFITIPITYILGIWRGYEYLYLPRLVMLGLIISSITRKMDRKSRFIINLLSLCLILSWMVFRIYNTWEDSSLLPYVFEPFYYFFQ